MKRRIIIFTLFAACTLFAQDEQMDAEMKAWTEYMTPGDMHNMLSELTGEWKTITKTWMAPDAEPMVSEGSVSSEMILGGRYLQMNHEGTTMGMPFSGISIEGYDNVKKKFVNIWIDNMGTGIAHSEGVYDPETKTITYTGTMSDPVTKQDTKFKNYFKFGETEHLFSMYADVNGQEHKWMEMKYVKK